MKYFIIALPPAVERAINIYPIFFYFISLIITLYNLYFSECLFGKTLRELGSTWYADLGPPFGVMYCIKCECVPVSVNRLLVVFSVVLLRRIMYYFFLLPGRRRNLQSVSSNQLLLHIMHIHERETHVYILFIYT